MRLFVRQDFGPALLHIDAGDDNIFHPTERWDRPVGHDKPRPVLQQGHLARTDQADDRSDGIEEPPCKKETPAGIGRKQSRQPERKTTLFLHRSPGHLQ